MKNKIKIILILIITIIITSSITAYATYNYLAKDIKYTKADGIITTKPALIKRAKELGLYTILRLFVIDSMAYSNIEHQLRTAKPDLIEVLPALMPKVLAKVCKLSTVPVIAGGLVSDKEDVMALLQAGVVSISSTNEKIWFL